MPVAAAAGAGQRRDHQAEGEHGGGAQQEGRRATAPGAAGALTWKASPPIGDDQPTPRRPGVAMTASSAASIPAAGTGLTDSRRSTPFSR